MSDDNWPVLRGEKLIPLAMTAAAALMAICLVLAAVRG